MDRELKDALKKKVQEYAKEGKLTCPLAFQAARELKVTPRTVCEVANELDIKIIQCQLGCF